MLSMFVRLLTFLLHGGVILSAIPAFSFSLTTLSYRHQGALQGTSVGRYSQAMLRLHMSAGGRTQTSPPLGKKKQKKSTVVSDEAVQDEANPLQPVGTKFFGGSAVKEELFDLDTEEKADKIIRELRRGVTEVTKLSYDRFSDVRAFPDQFGRTLGRRLQSEINAVLYDEAESEQNHIDDLQSLYRLNSFVWETPMSRDALSRTPLDELRNALNFYRRIDVAIVGCKRLGGSSGSLQTTSLEVSWMISFLWPNAWDARVLVTGTSLLDLEDREGSIAILKQLDILDNGGKDGTDVIRAVAGQVAPRFWDVYHIGMSPSAEVMQRLPCHKNSGFLSKYHIFEIAPRLVLTPMLVDYGGREMRSAQSLPNHAFSCIVKTVGPMKQRFVPTAPLEVRIKGLSHANSAAKKGTMIKWTVPVPAELASGFELPLPVLEKGKGEEGADIVPNNEDDASCRYEYQPRRRVAVVPFSGNPQDEGVADARRQLYESVMRDGFRPKLDGAGRPEFFFLQNEVKACFTEDGLGMAVYEARPSYLGGTNEVGIELEFD